MTDLQKTSFDELSVGQAIAALKRESYLLKYGRRGKPKFCPFRLSNDEMTIIWYVGKKEKQLRLSHVSRIMPGQRTPVFQRYPRPEKEYQSFSLIYGNRSLDVICRDKDEAEIWFVALKALISRNNYQKWETAVTSGCLSSDSSSAPVHRNSHSIASTSSSDIVYEDSGNGGTVLVPSKTTQQKRLGRTFSDLLFYTGSRKYSPRNEFVAKSFSSQSSGGLDDQFARSSEDGSQLSLSSAVSSSSQGSVFEDIEFLQDVFIWGEGIGDGLLGGGVHRIGNSCSARMDALLPKSLKSTMVPDARKISCGSRHAVLVTKHGEIYSWGEGSGGRLGHGVEADISYPRLIDDLSRLKVESVACGENHTCAVTKAGDLYTWGDGIHNFGLLGHETSASHWTPRKVNGQIEGRRITFISCGPWHSAAVTSEGLLFTFGEGTFGALGHGNRNSIYCPRVVEALKGLRTLRVSCGVWHTAAVVEIGPEPSSLGGTSAGKLYTWGSGDKGQLGHGDNDPRFVPSCVVSLNDKIFCQVACSHSMTVALTTLGQVYTMGSADYGQLGIPGSAGKLPLCIEGKLKDSYIEEIGCGSHHVAVLNSKSEVYTWGKGTHGQLGHGDCKDRNIPTLVKALGDTQVKSVVCGSNFTMAICLHRQVCKDDLSLCSGCHAPFNFRRKRHNCYNCGFVFCKVCCSRKSLKASLAPNMDKPYRVCEDCYSNLHKDMDMKTSSLPPKVSWGNTSRISSQVRNKRSSNHKPHRLLSRLSSFGSFKHSANRHSEPDRAQDSSNGHVLSPQNISSHSSPQNVNLLMKSSSTSSSSPSAFEYLEGTSVSLPGSTVGSQAASPVSVRSSHIRSISLSSAIVSFASPEVLSDDSKRRNDNFIKEIPTLREQVEVLSHKARLLEAELERTSRQLKEATEQARDEEEKNKAAKEVIKSLTTQLEDLTTRIGQGSSPTCRVSGSCSGSTSSTFGLTSTRSQLTS